jgi:glutamate--cysteine ligase
VPILDCSDINSFTSSIQSYVDSGKLFSECELYLPVRLKPKGDNTLENFKNGVSHIELRMFDLDPKQPFGVNEKDLEFSHLLLMYLSTVPDFEYTEKLQRSAVKNHQYAALANLIGIEIDGTPIIKKAEQIIDNMKWFYSDDEQALELLEHQRRKLYHRPCMSIRTKDIYQNVKEGDTHVRASRILRKGLHRYTQTASGFLFSL